MLEALRCRSTGCTAAKFPGGPHCATTVALQDSSCKSLSIPACCVQDGYVEERSALGPVNLTVPGGGSAGSLALPQHWLYGC